MEAAMGSGGNDWRGGWKEKRWSDDEDEGSEWVITDAAAASSQLDEDKKKDNKARRKGCTGGILSKYRWCRQSSSATATGQPNQGG